MKAEYIFYSEGKEILTLPNSKWCDTANPYIFAANKLHWINGLIKNGKVIRIKNNQNVFLLNSGQDLEDWIKNEFNSPSTGGFEKYIESGYH